MKNDLEKTGISWPPPPKTSTSISSPKKTRRIETIKALVDTNTFVPLPELQWLVTRVYQLESALGFFVHLPCEKITPHTISVHVKHSLKEINVF